MRSIDLIVVHCSATRCDRAFPVTALIRCHSDRFGFTGYHYYITRGGRTYQTRHEQLVGAHATRWAYAMREASTATAILPTRARRARKGLC